MLLTPYGNLNQGIYKNDQDPLQKIPSFRGNDADYKQLYNTWFEEMRDKVWPTWDLGSRAWTGGAAAKAEDATEAEIAISMDQFQNMGVLHKNVASIDGSITKNNLWHFLVEDLTIFDRRKTDSFNYRASQGLGANFLAYVTDIDIQQFMIDFWGGNKDREPSVLATKLLFQRPRPWTTATAFGRDDFAWHCQTPITHTGVHPAFPSGHCYQGIIHSCNVLQNWLDRQSAGGTAPDSDIVRALKQYATGWGDRRVFAGVHYPTDNIASWIFALRVAPFMFDNSTEIVDFIKDAIMNHSLVYRVIQAEFPNHPSLAPALELLNENFSASVG